MSDIRAGTISDAAGTGPITLTKQSPAKGYAMFDDTFTTEDSFNLSSTTSAGSGVYAGTLTSAVSSANKAVYLGTPRNMGAGVFCSISRATSSTTQWNARTRNKAGDTTDYAWSYALHGELA